MRGLALRVGIVAAVLGGGFLFRNFLPSNAGELAVGDCFDPPAGVSDTIDDVQHHPCTDAHLAEVVFVGDYEPATEAYPSTEEIQAFAIARCIPAFNAYTGLDYDQAQELGLDWYWPTSESWSDGNKKVICFAGNVDASQLTRSIKAQ